MPSKYNPGYLGLVKCGKFFLTSTFLLLRTTFSSLAVIPFKGGPLEKRRHFPSFYYYYFFKSGISCRYSFLPSPVPEFLTSPLRHFFGNFLSQWRINLKAFLRLDQWEYCVSWIERFGYYDYHIESI